MNYNFIEIHSQVLPLIKQASAIAKKYYFEGVKLEVKQGTQLSTSVVTQADKEVEAFLTEKLSELFPEFGFIGEESDIGEIKEYNWIIDPIDGTLNFGTGIPLFGISVALWKGNEPIYAIVSFPALNEIIHAGNGEGLFLNDKKVEAREWLTEKQSLLYSHVGADADKLKIYESLVKNNIPFPRYLGGTVYSGTAIALRKAHGLICINNGLWDIAAIVLLVKEAGLHVEWLSKKPDLENKKKLKEYCWSVVMGEEKLTQNISQMIRS